MRSSILGSQFSARDVDQGALANRVQLAALELIGRIRRKKADWKNGRFIRTLEALDNRRDANDRLTTVILALFAGVCLGTVAARAQDATWEPSAGAGTGDWNTPGNWTPGSVPTATGTATFGNSGLTQITVSGFPSVGTLHFNAGAPPYIFNINFLRITGFGIVNLSSNSPTFVNNTDAETEFDNASTAASATINNNGGGTVFNRTSTAASATITNNAGSTLFNNTSTAGSATINNNGGGIFFTALSLSWAPC